MAGKPTKPTPYATDFNSAVSDNPSPQVHGVLAHPPAFAVRNSGPGLDESDFAGNGAPSGFPFGKATLLAGKSELPTTAAGLKAVPGLGGVDASSQPEQGSQQS
jgi:hypothetical protein